MDFSSAVSTLFELIPELYDFSRHQDIYLVGGAVRDILLGRTPTDYDLVVSVDPEIIARRISSASDFHFFKMGKNRQTVFRGKHKNLTLDFVRMAGDSIEADLLVRDFTINAMAFHLGRRSFLDPLKGRADLEKGILRMVSDEIFMDDPLRLLRTYRFAAALNFDIEHRTETSVRTHRHLMNRPSGERIREELLLLMRTPSAAGYLRKMSDSGLLFDLFPEMIDEAGCMQNHHHAFNVLEHTLSACNHMDLYLNGMGMNMLLPFELAVHSIHDSLKPFLKLAMLLHDSGKPLTRTVHKDGSVHFLGHEKIGAQMADGISSRLKFSNYESGYLRLMILHHLRPSLLFQSHQNQSLTRKGMIRLFRSVNQHTPDLLLMALADFCAKTEHPADMDRSFFSFIAELLEIYFDDYVLRKNEERLISGHDLITVFGLTPSPVFKIILEAAEEAWLSQTISTRQEALTWIHSWLNAHEKTDFKELKMIDNPEAS